MIDLMLAHVPKGLSRSAAAYNRAAYMDQRARIAQEWTDLLVEGLVPAAELLGGARR